MAAAKNTADTPDPISAAGADSAAGAAGAAGAADTAGSPDTPDTPDPNGTTPPNTKLLIGILVAAAFVVILNETTLSVALPVLMRYFTISADAAQWLTTSFMLTMAVVIPLTGYVLQRFTLRQVYIAALALFLAGTGAAAAAPSFAVLLAARIVQASGTALIIPMLMTTIMRLVPLERRGGVFGLVTVVIAVAPALGPTFSGVVLHALGWRWIFLLMLPLVVVALLVGAVLIRNFEAASRPYLDVLSVLLSAIGFAATIYGLSGLADLAFGVPYDRVAVLTVGVATLGWFFRRQVVLGRAAAKAATDSGPTPLLDLAPLRSREYKWSAALLLVVFALLFGFIILLPLFAQNVLGFSESLSGLVILPGGLAMGLLGPVVGNLFDRHGPRPLIIPGAVALTLAMVGLAWMSATSGFWFVTAVSLVLHVGIAFLLTPLISNALANVPDQLASHGQAILNTFQQVAGGAGTALFIAIMTVASTRAAAGGAPQVESLATGVHVAFVVGAVLSACVTVATVVVRLESPHKPD